MTDPCDVSKEKIVNSNQKYLNQEQVHEITFHNNNGNYINIVEADYAAVISSNSNYNDGNNIAINNNVDKDNNHMDNDSDTIYITIKLLLIHACTAIFMIKIMNMAILSIIIMYVITIATTRMVTRMMVLIRSVIVLIAVMLLMLLVKVMKMMKLNAILLFQTRMVITKIVLSVTANFSQY